MMSNDVSVLSVAQNEYEEWLKSQPKQYSIDIIDNFMADRQQGQEIQLQEKLRKFFEYSEQFATKQHELPPSLRLTYPIEPTGAEQNTWG